jgi:magnesium transporter
VISSYYRDAAGHLATGLSNEAIKEALASGEGLLWLDLEAPTREEGEPVLAGVFRFHPLTIDDCFNRHIDPAKIDDYGDYIFIIAQAISYLAKAERLQTTELDLYLGPNYVVSFHELALPFVQALRHRCEEDGPELARGADFLAHTLLDALVDDYQPAVDELDETLEHVEELALAKTQPGILEQILLLKRNVQRLRRTIIPQRDVVNRLARGEFPRVVRPEANIYFRDIYDHVVRVEQLVESVRDLADGVLNTYLSALNNRMNEVMKTLSVVASVILPLTFIASIYGMNFENMPELGWEWGYFGILGAMAGIGLGLVLFFRIRRWF